MSSQPKSHVLLVNYEYPPLGGGAATASEQIARELALAGHRVTMLTSAFGDLPRNEVLNGVEIRRIRVWRRRKDRCSIPEMITFMISGAMAGRAFVKQERVDATLAFFTIPCGHIGLLGKWAAKVPYIISLRGGDVPGAKGWNLALFHTLCLPLTKLIWSRASSVVANSQGLRDLAQRRCPKTVDLIPNGVDTTFFSHPTAPATQRDIFEILFVGRLSVHKDLPTLLRALKRLRADLTLAARLTIIGDGPERAALEQLTRQLGLDGRVNFRGWMDRRHLREAYQKADVLVLPSLDEGMPNVVLEAMACGLPVVATSIKGIVDLVEDGQTGFLFPPGDDQALSNQLAQLIRNHELRRVMGAAVRRRAEEFSWKETARQYSELISQAIEQNKKH